MWRIELLPLLRSLVKVGRPTAGRAPFQRGWMRQANNCWPSFTELSAMLKSHPSAKNHTRIAMPGKDQIPINHTKKSICKTTVMKTGKSNKSHCLCLPPYRTPFIKWKIKRCTANLFIFISKIGSL